VSMRNEQGNDRDDDGCDRYPEPGALMAKCVHVDGCGDSIARVAVLSSQSSVLSFEFAVLLLRKGCIAIFIVQFMVQLYGYKIII